MLYRILVYGNLFISLAAGILCAGYAKFISAEKHLFFGVCALGATLFIYSFQRIFRLPDLILSGTERNLWLVKHKAYIYALGFLGGVAAAVCYLLFFYDLSTLIFLFFFGIISMLYAFKGIPKLLPLREIPFLKIWLVSITWTGVCFVWPMLYSDSPIDPWMILGCFLFFFGSTIPFDIRDLAYDLPKQRTIPQLIGVQRATFLTVGFLIASFILLLWRLKEINLLALCLVFLFQIIGVITANIIKKEWVYSLCIDGGVALLGLVFWIAG
jgi:hypothetical protein